MICYRCGREQPEKSPYCKGCGAQLRRHKKVRSDSLLNVLKNSVTVGKRTYEAWQVLAGLGGACVLLIGLLFAVPPILNMIAPESVQEQISSEPENAYDPGQKISFVTGNIIDCTVPLGEHTVTGESAYVNGSWQKDCVVSERIVLRFIRRPIAESWVNTHIFQMYPDVLEVDQFTEAIDVSGYTAARIQFSSQSAPDCVIEALCVNDGSFDYMFITEMPYDMFEEYSMYLDEWFFSLALVDAQTGVESYNPAALNTVSSVDVPVTEE